MKKHAILIIAHNQFEILKKLITMLDDKRNDIYIHVDKKSKNFKKEEFDNICKYSSLMFIPRINTYWGDSSLVECELQLMEAALSSNEDYCYFHLLSGVDLQIKKTEEIHDFFDKNPNKQFIALRYAASSIKDIDMYHFFLPLRSYNKYIAKVCEVISISIQKIMRIHRLKNCDFILCKSQQWFSITQECAQYVVSQRKFIKKLTRFTNCSDEIFLGTVIVNSKYKQEIYEPFRSVGGHMRLIDRQRCEGASPHTWKIEDWNIIKESSFFWARKFDLYKDEKIIDLVFKEWS